VTDDLLGADLVFGETGLGWDLHVTGGGDLETVGGTDNLVQALTLRLNTQRGGLSPLGHADYGSRLAELIGQPNNATARNLVRFYTLECIRQEARVREVLDIKVETTPEQGRVDVHLSLLPIGDKVPLNLVFPFYLEA
jgi:phage baseplate assembly protein W